MVQLDTDPFLNELNKLFDRNKETGSVTCTMKRSETMPRHRAAQCCTSYGGKVHCSSGSLLTRDSSCCRQHGVEEALQVQAGAFCTPCGNAVLLHAMSRHRQALDAS